MDGYPLTRMRSVLMRTEFHRTAIGHWLDAIECGCRFGPGAKGSSMLLLLLKEPWMDPTWVHGYQIGCYIRDAWQRLR